MDSGVSVDSRPSSAPGSVNSFTARQFADYEKRLAEENITRPAGAHLPLSSEKDGPPRPVTMPAYAQDSFASKDFVAYEKRLSATRHEQASAMEAGTAGALPESGITVELNNAVTLPDKRYPMPVRNIRHKILSVYRRISTLVIIANLVALVHMVASSPSVLDMEPSYLATATSVNFFCTIAVRQEWVVNAMYGACLLTPLSAPLRLRRLLDGLGVGRAPAALGTDLGEAHGDGAVVVAVGPRVRAGAAAAAAESEGAQRDRRRGDQGLLHHCVSSTSKGLSRPCDRCHVPRV